jgi:G3E family GTPase
MDTQKFGMHLLLFTGFLGSGKTSYVIPLAKAVVETNRRTAIIVNEIGEIGIDNRLMRQLDLNVWELLNGCICCTLSSDLVTTIQKLDADFSPDLTIVEASGAADPGNVCSALPYYRGRPFRSRNTISVLDPLRLQMLIEVLTPLITSQIRNADLILVNKIDLASPSEVAFALRTAKELNPEAKILPTQAQNRLDPALISALVPWLD